MIENCRSVSDDIIVDRYILGYIYIYVDSILQGSPW